MRLKVTRLRRAIKRDFRIRFGHEQLTSYGGLELLRRFFQFIRLRARIQCAFAGQPLGGDYGASHLVLLVIGLLIVGARRLQHLRYLANDSLFVRFCGLSRIPSDRTVVNWLKTTHYFWAIAQGRAPKGENATESLFHDFQRTVQEDVEVFEAQQRSLELKPDAPMVTIKSDAGPIAARRIIERLMHSENLGEVRRRA